MPRFNQAAKTSGELHDRLVQGILVKPCPPSPRQWIAGGTRPENSVKLAVGDAIKLADGLKIMVQYARILGVSCHAPDTLAGRFLAGHSDTCVGTLAWLAPLLEQVKPDDFPELPERLTDWTRTGTPAHDKAFAGYVLNTFCPGAKKYEVLVAQNILRLESPCNRQQFLTAFQGWRSSGLMHCLLTAAQFMPNLNDWLPVDLHEDAKWFATLLCELNGCGDLAGIRHAMESTLLGLNAESNANTYLAATLDRIAVLMRVKSNSDDGDLDRALSTWSLGVASKPHEIWGRARRQLEAAMPPSVLCPGLYGRRRDSWGFRSLTLFWESTSGLGRLGISQRELEFLAKQDGAPYLPKYDPSVRVFDVVSRLGEIVLSKEMGYLMMYAYDGAEFLRTKLDSMKENEHMTCGDPYTLLAYMEDSDHYMSPPEHIESFQRELESGLPQVTPVDCEPPLALTCWRLDPPGRILLFTGQADLAVTAEPHARPKRVLDERSCAKSVARIRLSDLAEREADVVSKLLYYAHRDYTTVHETLKRGGPGHINTSVAEALSCFVLEKPKLHSKVPMHSTSRWENSYSDKRYAETQEASNGVRYRDWVELFSEGELVQKARLDSHVFTVDRVYKTQFPWRRGNDSLDWVNVVSSAPPSLMVLYERMAQSKDDFKGLLASVKSRVLQDLKLLPVQDESHRVERANTSVYGDASTGQVCVVYAPIGAWTPRVEFMLFELCRDGQVVSA